MIFLIYIYIYIYKYIYLIKKKITLDIYTCIHMCVCVCVCMCVCGYVCVFSYVCVCVLDTLTIMLSIWITSNTAYAITPLDKASFFWKKCYVFPQATRLALHFRQEEQRALRHVLKRMAPKVMPFIFLCSPIKSDANVCCMSVEVKFSQIISDLFCLLTVLYQYTQWRYNVDTPDAINSDLLVKQVKQV